MASPLPRQRARGFPTPPPACPWLPCSFSVHRLITFSPAGVQTYYLVIHFLATGQGLSPRYEWVTFYVQMARLIVKLKTHVGGKGLAPVALPTLQLCRSRGGMQWSHWPRAFAHVFWGLLDMTADGL